ncbi:hypothetical protein IEQ34_026365 [Dendrobium chrysotoxum]|uniref:Remorin C-terminal domain-containing protein n=1 Tax=Dendrobium chrysotoxum TaxID=161865 RepID=A0AAV7FLN7_DENCH|nr:hypothetical protein IEQ34_026365 [Dendrobium chrysotoxum]
MINRKTIVVVSDCWHLTLGQNIKTIRGQMNYLENLSDGEYEIVVAATAYAITTLEEEEDSLKRKKTVEGLTRTKSKLEDKTTRTSFNWSFKWLSGKEAKQDEIKTGDTIWHKSEKAEKAASKKYSSRYTDAGEESDASPTFKKMPTLTKKHPTEKVTTRVQSGKETIVGTKATSTKKSAEFSPGYKNWDEDSNKLDEIETQADAWEKAKMINAKNRYEKMMSVISEWQTEKKEKAKRRMERKQKFPMSGLLAFDFIKLLTQKLQIATPIGYSSIDQNAGGPEHKRDKAWQHYNNEISRINKIAGNARALAKERMRNDEMKIREKAAKIRSTGRVPGASWTCC